MADRFCVDCGITLSTSSAVTVVNGLSHLNGETVSVLANGLVQAQKVVASGQITLATPLAAGTNKVHVGLPFDAEVQTLPATAQIEAFAKGRRKNVVKTWVQVFESGSFYVGPNTSDLVPSDPYGEVVGLVSQEVDVTLLGNWNPDGKIVIRQSNPLPLTVVSIAQQIALGGS